MALLKNETKIKLLWYLLLSAIGVFHAEVLSGSMPDVLYNPASFALVTPVYAVHYVLFGDLMMRYGRSNRKVLYLFGCLTGMYETFITKVYWSPPWNPEAAGPLGVAWVELLWIGFTWHAFMSFIIPFTLMNGLFSPGKSEAFRTRDLRAILLVAPVMGAILGYGFGRSIEAMLTSVLLSLLVITLLAVAFVVGARRWGFTRTEQLVFGKRGRRLAIAAFIGVYIVYGILLRPEFFPVGIPLTPVLLIYAGLIALLVLVLRSPAPSPRALTSREPTLRTGLKFLSVYAISFGAFFLAFGALNALAPGVLTVMAAASIFIGAALPVVLLSVLAVKITRARLRKFAVGENA